MTRGFDHATLGALYDKGRLVPFTGSGMSAGECHSWKSFVAQLAAYAGVDPSHTDTDPVRRASHALDSLRRQGKDIGKAVRETVYTGAQNQLTHNRALAQLYWPLVCTTNYDDVYLSEVVHHVRKGVRRIPRVRGRSELDCRRILQHLSFPVGEVVWALQGFLAPRTSDLEACLGEHTRANLLESELVVGPVEYRQAAHLSPQFRRSFSELFRHRSLLFLGAGLSEPYILNLFDEVAALAGPPSSPHFAFVEEDSLDIDLMREHYHVICNTYPKGAYPRVSEFLDELALFVNSERTRSHAWSYRLNAPTFVMADHQKPHFEIIRAPLPHSAQLGEGDVVAISCGRASGSDRRGDPTPSHLIHGRVSDERRALVRWHNDWTVSWGDDTHPYGVVARHLYDDDSGSVTTTDPSSYDQRSPEAVRLAFKAFLQEVASRGAKQAHVQLLAAGEHRAFSPWMSLVQMARAYGQWRKEVPRDVDALRVAVYVVAPDVIALLNAGQLNLAEHLEDSLLRLNVEVIDGFGSAQTHQEMVRATDLLGNLPVFSTCPTSPLIHAIPAPRPRSAPVALDGLTRRTELRDFGLVSGSTLVVDYRPRSISAGGTKTDDSTRASADTSPARSPALTNE